MLQRISTMPKFCTRNFQSRQQHYYQEKNRFNSTLHLSIDFIDNCGTIDLLLTEQSPIFTLQILDWNLIIIFFLRLR